MGYNRCITNCYSYLLYGSGHMGLFNDIDWDETANRTDKFLKNKK